MSSRINGRDSFANRATQGRDTADMEKSDRREKKLTRREKSSSRCDEYELDGSLLSAAMELGWSAGASSMACAG